MAEVIEFPSGAKRSNTILRKEPMTMAQLVAERLRQWRRLRGISQKQLSEKARGVSARTISRVENGRLVPRAGTIERLAKALDIDPGDLTGEKPMPVIVGQPNAAEGEPAYPFYVRVHPAVRNAFELVARRYRVSVPRITQLAPLFFVILAEASLEHRRRTVEESRTKAEEFREAASQLPLGILAFVNDDEIRREEESIEERDIFGSRFWNDTLDSSDQDNPFATYLKALAEKYAGDDVSINVVGPTSIDYQVCRAAALALADRDQELAETVLAGGVLVHKMLRALTPEQRDARMRELQAPDHETVEEIPDKVYEPPPLTEAEVQRIVDEIL